MDNVLCTHCGYWVKCKNNGFCLIQDLFTYTNETECEMFEEGIPITEEEYNEANNPSNWLELF